MCSSADIAAPKGVEVDQVDRARSRWQEVLGVACLAGLVVFLIRREYGIAATWLVAAAAFLVSAQRRARLGV